jgi:hypothetical protein
MFKKLLVPFFLFFVISCATNPDKIASAYVSPMQYAAYDCDQIALEQANVERRVAMLYANLKKDAKGDRWQTGVGVVLFWPVLIALEGGDSPATGEYALMKGQYEALQTVAIQKKCSLTFTKDLYKTIEEK